MKLCTLLKNLNCRVLGSTVVEINGLYHCDTEVKENGLFFCLRGTRVDGTKYVLSAIKNGAVAIVSEQEIPGLVGTTQIIVKNAREFMSLLACKFFGNPAEKLKIIGVTGTNGKTTTTQIIAKCLTNNSKKCGIIGTNGVFILDKKYDSSMTTPDPIELQKYLSLMVKNKIEYVCIEVSAHAIDLSKIDGIKFDVAVFTNLTEDHLDYFKTIERYFNAKLRFFSKKYTNFAVLNFDSEFGIAISKSINFPFKSYAINNEADAKVTFIEQNSASQSFTLQCGERYEINLLGKFNIYNSLAAILILNHLGLTFDEIKKGLALVEPIDGRFNISIVCKRIFVIDYAHTPDGLKNSLVACRELACGKNVISVFGCGGNRETQKRSIMGEISSKFADLTIISSDNPRFEKREDIAKEIEKGIEKGSNYKIILDRSEAIETAFLNSKEGDVILLAGKGSENYIEECGIKIPYSDKAEVEKIRRKNE